SNYCRQHKATKIHKNGIAIESLQLVKRLPLCCIIECQHRYNSIIDKMRKNWYPDIIRPNQHISKECSEYHAGKKSEKLYVNSTKDNRCHPNRHVNIFENTIKNMHQRAPEVILFSDCWEYG